MDWKVCPIHKPQDCAQPCSGVDATVRGFLTYLLVGVLHHLPDQVYQNAYLFLHLKILPNS